VFAIVWLQQEPLVVSSNPCHKTDDSTGLAEQVAADLRIVRCRQAGSATAEGVRRGDGRELWLVQSIRGTIGLRKVRRVLVSRTLKMGWHADILPPLPRQPLSAPEIEVEATLVLRRDSPSSFTVTYHAPTPAWLSDRCSSTPLLILSNRDDIYFIFRDTVWIANTGGRSSERSNSRCQRQALS
jgi:hypothetical protein